MVRRGMNKIIKILLLVFGMVVTNAQANDLTGTDADSALELENCKRDVKKLETEIETLTEKLKEKKTVKIYYKILQLVYEVK